jgi:hypothetical protein
MARDVADYYCPELVDTVKILLMDIFIPIIENQCTDSKDSK